MTTYPPAVPLAVAVIAAVPPLPIVAVPLERTAEAPLEGALKLIMPPATGSIGFLAVTVTASAFLNAWPVGADCGVLPVTGVSVNPWLWNAPMSGFGESSGSPR